MIDGIKSFDKVNKDHIRFEVVFAAELEGSFEEEDGVGASFSLETTILYFHAFILNINIHVFSDDGRYDFICDVQKADGVPVVGVGGLSLELKDGKEGAKSPSFWNQFALPDRLENLQHKDDGAGMGLVII